MEETGILENPNLTSACYLALNQAQASVFRPARPLRFNHRSGNGE